MSANQPRTLETLKIAVIGLGYVGLPLAAEFGKKFDTIGFDINTARIDELRSGKDSTLEVSPEELAESNQLSFTDSVDQLKAANFFIVTVPTPIDAHKRPDLTPLIMASKTIAAALKVGDVVVYESTVYPGATEEDCIPILEEISGLTYNVDFFAGYSPERINPGDKEHRVADIKKVTSGSTPEIAQYVDDVYSAIIRAGTHLAPSIQVAEAAKVIENTQRDVNIALVNELALIFDRLNIDTAAVLEAAGTKWNFLPFKPGLVGGHCIGVDPYYLTHKAQSIGYNPEMILAGRRINDGMGAYVAGQVVKLMIGQHKNIAESRVLVLGLAFKENCPDIRNTRVTDIVAELREYKVSVDIHDPWVNPAEAEHEYQLQLTDTPRKGDYDAVILAVAHHQFTELGAEGIRALCNDNGIVFDVKSLLPAYAVDGRL